MGGISVGPAAISQSVEQLQQVMSSGTMDAMELAKDLISLGAQQTVDLQQLEYMGNLIDTYA